MTGDFNTELGARNSAATKEGQFGYKQKKHTGQILANFMEKEGFFKINTFKKQTQRKWTYLSHYGSTKYEIGFIISTKWRTFNDVSVVNRVKTGNGHRLARGTFNINAKLERFILIKSTL